MPNPTIVAASLDDKELRDSISNLVAHVKRGLHTMLTDTNSAVDAMEKKLKSLGDLKIDSGGSADGGASRRTKAQNAETDAVEKTIAARDKQIKQNKEVEISFDQMAKAQRQAVSPTPTQAPQIKSARESYLAFVQGFKAQGEAISRQIKDAEAALNKAVENRVNELNAKLTNAKAKLNELNVELAKQRMNAERTGNYSTYNAGITRTTQAIEYQMKHIAELQKKISEVSPNMFTQQVQGISALRREQERVANIMKEDVTTRQQSTSATQQQLTAEQKLTDEIHKQAQAIRESKQWKEKGFVTVNGRDVYNFEGSDTPLKNRVTLEEQLLRLQELEKSTSKEITEEGAKRLTQEQLELAITGSTKETLQKSRDILRAMTETRQATATFTAQLESANRLNEKLKELRTRYNEMTFGQRMSAEGQEIAKNIRIITRETQKLQSQLSRPANFKEALGLPEKTLDDMVYKMRQLQSYKLGVNITDQKGLDRLKEVDQQIARLKKQYDDLMVKNMQVIQSNTALGRSWNYMKNRLAFYFTVGASTAFIRSLIDVRGQYELLERSIGILIDSAQNGSQIFAELNAMAIKSPFTTMELGAAAKQLVAYDVAAKDVVETTKRLADMAAAVGIPIERLTYALGQIKAYGYLNARDARMFANAGIPLVKELADRYTELEGRLVSTADVYDRIKKKAISYEDVMDTVNKMTDEGGKFFNFQEKAADTLKVKIANLTLAWNNMLNEMGKDNQSIIGGGLNATKQILEHWRDINNMMLSVVSTIGLLKTAQTAYLLLTSKVVDKTRALTIMQTVLGQKVALNLAGLGASFMKFVSNPANLAAAAIAGLVAWLGKAAYDYYDLVKANEEFNESIVTNAEENIKSIDKFFKDYYDQLSTVGSLNSADQTKLWERIQEEIEKTTKNAEEYVRVLEKIENISERISAGEAVLEQSKRIQEELKRLAERETFDIGGGFADDTLAENLQETSKYANALIKQYGSLEEAEKKLGLSSYGNDWKDYKAAIAEAEGELESVTQKLDKVNIAEVLGSGDVETQLANVRAFAHAWRDAFLATEKGSKIGIEGQTLLNNKLDEWITKQAVANGLIKDREINNLRVDAQAIVNIEKNRTAWEEFFRYLNNEERKRLDVAIKTNQLESDSIQKIWDDVAKRMKESSTTSYNLIQEQIANLRETPAIFIDIIYREKKENLDAQQKAFEDRYITPQSPFLLDPDKYLKEEKANREKYGRFIKKQGEDNVEWEKRLGQEYQNNEKSIKSLTDQIAKSANMSDVDKKAKQGELDTLTAQQKVLKEIEKDQGFNYDQFKKGKKGGSKKDILGDALAKEVQIIGEIQKRYKEYQQMGVNAQEAVTLATEEYGNTLRRTNATLAKYGISTKTSDELAGMDIREVRDYYKALLEGAKNKDNAKGIEAIEKALAGINVEITKLDYKKITDGLNNELGKLKEEYELAVELDADPELGGIFADMFDINADQLPHTISDYAARVTDELNKAIKSRGDNIQLPSIIGLTNDDIKAFKKLSEDGGLNVQSFEEIKKAYKELWDLRRKAATDVAKMVNDYIREYGDLSAQIQQIETEKNDALIKLNEIYNTDALRQTQRYVDAKNAIEDAARRKSAKAAFEALKKENDYERFFTAIDTLTKDDALQVKNRIKQGIIDAFKNGGLTVAQFRKEIKALEEQFDKLSEPTSTWFAYLNGGFDKLMQRAKATGQELEVIGEKMRVTGKLDEKDKNYLETLGNIFKDDSGNKTGFSSLFGKFGGDIKKLGQSVSQAGQGMQSGASSFASAISIVDMIIKGIHQTVQAIDSVIQELNSTRSEENKIGNAYWEGFKKFDNYAFSGWENLKSGNVAGAMGDTVNSIISIFNMFEDAKNERINKQIKESVRAVQKLDITVESLKDSYEEMTDAAEHSYGAQSAAATLAASSMKEQEIALKRLMLAETKRQLRLEQSRSSKRRDTEKELALQKEIISQQNEIDSMLRETDRAVEEVVDSLLGISRGSWAEELTDALISALRNGENYMKTFEESWEEMVQNMVVKTIAARVIGDALEKNVLSRIEQIEKEETDPYRESQANIAKHKANLQNLRLENEKEWLATISQYQEFPEVLSKLGEDAVSYFTDEEKIANRMFAQMFGGKDQFLEKYGDQLEQELFKIYDNYNAGIEGTLKDAQQTAQERALKEVLTGDSGKLTMEELKKSISFLPDLLKEYSYPTKQKLNALQQGISGITEQQAGALESYWNANTQQQYIQSNLLTQIRDVVVGMNMDVQLSTMAQMLLQLQNNYIVMQSMQAMMESWTVPSGQGIRVEMM